MSKKNSGLLNQNIEENIEEQIIDNESVVDDSEEMVETVEESIQLEKKWEDSGILDNLKNTVDVQQIINNVPEEIKIIPQKRTIESLNRDEYRSYLRTGRIPD